MADDCTHLTFLGIAGDSFRFGEVVEDEVDGFRYSRSDHTWIRGPFNRFLIFNGADFELRDLPDGQIILSDNKLNITFYQTGSCCSNSHSERGLTVVLSTQRGHTNYALVCKDDTTLVAEEMEKRMLDQTIACSHRALFRMIEYRDQMFKFKCFHVDKYLGFDQNSDTLTLVDDPESQCGFQTQ